MIRLEPFTADRLGAMEALVGDPAVLRFSRIPEPPPPDFTRTWFERYEQGRRDGTREAFAIVGDDGAFLGLALAPTIDRETATAELGYLVAAEARGRGIATEALRLLTTWAFDELRSARLELFISIDNEPSKRVAAAAGYVRDGVLRSAFFKQGRREDTELWSRLPTDR